MAQQVSEHAPVATVGAGHGRTFRGAALRHIAMPLGGIGTGQVSLCGDGALRQWEIVNHANHLAAVPDSFFAVRATSGSDAAPETVTRILQSREVLELPAMSTPLINDDAIPDDQRLLLERYRGVERTVFTGAYPFAGVTYLDDDLPVEVQLEAYSPFVPLDAESSSLPAVIFTFRLHNPSNSDRVEGELAAMMKNVVGWDGVAPISANRCPAFGGNTNRIVSTDRYTALVMENASLAGDDPGQGQLVLAALTPDARPSTRWADVDDFMSALMSPDAGGDPGEHAGTIPSDPGETWNGGLRVPYALAPGESGEMSFVLAWSFPNRYANFIQANRSERADFRRSRLWLGNAYSERFASALDTIDSFVGNRQRLDADSRAWSDAVLSSTLPTWIAEFLAAQGALIRSPTVFQSDDGKLYGFEGANGASTPNKVGGSCPLNCTHVWNYEQALSRLFPELEQTMRETDLDYAQAPEGYIPHRTIVPLYVRQLWGEPVGGAPRPAVDGMLGTILKVYREVRQGAASSWLDQYWPKVKLLLSYIERKWDPDNDGVLTGEQPNTYDIAFHGTDMFIGGLWLATLRAMEELARIQQEDTFADELGSRFVRARDAYHALLWNGEYYVQRLEAEDPREYQYQDGCLADQLLGQWWAHQLELGYILPQDRVRRTLRSIVRYNLREGFDGWVPEERIFADGDDTGLLLLTWPRGGRPDRPTRYHDEVWTGIEYQVAAHCIMEGLVDEGIRVLEAARDRYSGVKRNPYNDIECGDHYARAMSGWTVLEALGGYRYSAVSDSLAFAPVELAYAAGSVRLPFVTATGWGQFTLRHGRDATLTARFGEVSIASLTLPPGGPTAGVVTIDGKRVDATVSNDDAQVTVTFQPPVVLRRGQELAVID